jgi:CRP-like cAMP-binding protein
VEDCTAIELTTASLLTLAETDLEQFALIYMNIARELSRRLRLADERQFRTQVGAANPAPERSYLAT